LETRPTEIVVRATAQVGADTVTSEITIRMGEVSKFTKLRVKLLPVDERTASDSVCAWTLDEVKPVRSLQSVMTP
jgi:hypothetical protein